MIRRRQVAARRVSAPYREEWKEDATVRNVATIERFSCSVIVFTASALVASVTGTEKQENRGNGENRGMRQLGRILD